MGKFSVSSVQWSAGSRPLTPALLYVAFHLPCLAIAKQEGGGAGVLVCPWNRCGAFVGELEPLALRVGHSNR